MRKFMSIILLLFIVILYFGILIFLLSLINSWLLENSMFGFTYKKIDVRVLFLGFILFLFSIWLVVELDDYLRFKAWRRSWK